MEPRALRALARRQLAAPAPPPLSRSFGDFDADGYTDVLPVHYVGTYGTSAFYQWGYIPQGTQPKVLAPFWTTAGPNDVRFGDFDADRRTDVFVGEARADGLVQYRYSSAGVGPLTNLA